MTKILSLIKKLRCKHEYSQEYMAAKLGVTQSNYSRIELGKQSIEVKQLINILSLLHVDTNEILDNMNDLLQKALHKTDNESIIGER